MLGVTAFPVIVTTLTLHKAYRAIRVANDAARIREIMRRQSRFESNHAKRQRLRKEADWRRYTASVRESVTRAMHLRQRVGEEMQAQKLQ